jgi:uncharacterized protein YhjY with autotransporter beta-barrel domain
MNLRISLMVITAALLATPTMADEIINFDNLANNTQIANGYEGLNWDDIYVATGSTFPSNEGYNTGVVSTPNDAYQGFGGLGTISNNTAFSVRSVYVTSADPTNTVIFQGFSGATLVYNLTFNVNATAPTLETLNFANITSITFNAQGFAGNIVLDDLDVVFGPLTSSFAATPGLTPNQTSIARNIDFNSATPSPQLTAIITALQNLPANAVPGALDELSPQAFGQFTSTTAFNNASFETEAQDNYLASQRKGPNGTFVGGNGRIDASGLTVNDPSYDPSLTMVHSRLMAWNPAPYGSINDSASVLGGVSMKDPKDMKSIASPSYTDPWNFYVRGNVVLAQGFSEPGVSHFDSNTASVQLGTDYRLTPNLLVGLTAGYGHTDVTLDNQGSSATVDSYSPGLYASYANHGWYANFSGNYTHDAYSQSRVIGFLGQTATSAPEGNEGTANLDGGYDFHHGPWTFGPLAGLQYTHLTVDGYNESGSVADLSVNEQQSDSLRSRLGGRVSFDYSHFGVQFTPHLDASWQHEFLDQSRGINSQFNGGSGSFNVQTTNPSRDSALVDAGLDAAINQTIDVFADYTVQAGQENYFGQSVQGGVRIGF